MKRRIIKVATALLTSVVILLLLWLISIYSIIYPRSSQVQIRRPVINSFFENAFGHKRDCKSLYWSFDAQTDDSWSEVATYYSKKWNQESSPGGNASGYTWDSFKMFAIQNSNYGVFAYRQVLYPDYHAVPLKYHMTTTINFCKLNNWHPSE